MALIMFPSFNTLVFLKLNSYLGHDFLMDILFMIGVGLKSEHLKFIDSTNFFSYTYHTDHKNGFVCPELVNLNKSRPDTFLILFLPKPK